MRKTIWKDNSWPRWRPVRDASFVDQRRVASRAEISGKILFFKCNFSIIPGKLVRTKEWDVRVVWQEPRRTLIVSPAAVAIKLRARRISLCRIKAALMRLSRVFDPFPILLSIRGKGQSSRLLSFSFFLVHLFSFFLFLASSILLSLSLCPSLSFSAELTLRATLENFRSYTTLPVQFQHPCDPILSYSMTKFPKGPD